ncbi:site-specific integrase [Bacillus sp. MUM 13]|uniref:site-specific integrase n=1 Tax=Bacillus sp. MUM 13 TaxID=1678001 RepID=UPI0008F5825A|nr:site-specific integrase [Bacillus sp. MUM 13]OIK11274.1 hypothetical protein BIV59_12855 [Bacillus sp. MUM 13]
MATAENDIMEQLIDSIEEYNYSRYNLQDSIEEAIEILENETNRKTLSQCRFEEDKWYLEIPLKAKRRSIDFNDIKEVVQFNVNINTEDFINIVKCWTASLLEHGYNAETIGTMVNEGLRTFIILTKGFTETNEEELIEEIVNLSIFKQKNICSSTLNFLDYCPYLGEEYASLLYSIKPNIEAKARLLPPSKDILIFSKIIEDYFSRELSELEYRKWFPVWLWWNLTTLIPLRPSEFCTIERDCLINNDGNFYIKLPRHKQRFNNKRQIQIIDEINIPEELYRKIEAYKQITKTFGRTDTLISYLSITKCGNKLNPYMYSLPVFRDHLNDFYEEIVFGEYKVTEITPSGDQLFITKRLLPGDTRHLAFINLNRQGYHPVEIARIGGHSHLQSQNHYFNHVQNFVDLEILELITNVDLGVYKNKIADSESKNDQIISMSFIEKYVLRPSHTDFKRKMRDGYCTDQHQRCKVEDCWECDSWRISEEEFKEKQDVLAKKIKDSESKINEVIGNLKDIYKGIYTNVGNDEFYSANNLEIRKELINKSKRIDDAIRKYVNLAKVKERIE